MKKNNFQPRVSMAYAPGKTVFRTGFGVFVGPGQGEDLIQPIESDRVSSTLTSGALLQYPLDSNAGHSNFVSNPNNRSYQPRAYAAGYNIPEKIYQYTASVQRELGSGFAATAAYVGSQGRNLFLRSVGNQLVDVVTNPNPASAAFQIREFSIVTRNANGKVTGVQQPYAEIDFKTSGGHDAYNAMMLSLNRRSSTGLGLNVQYTLGRSRGTSGGSNEANTAGNNALTEESSSTKTATTTSTSGTPSARACSTRCPSAMGGRSAATGPAPSRRSWADGRSAACSMREAACRPCPDFEARLPLRRRRRELLHESPCGSHCRDQHAGWRKFA